MINVTPDHPIAHEAYEQVKNLRCVYVNIIAHTFKKSDTEQGFLLQGFIQIQVRAVLIVWTG